MAYLTASSLSRAEKCPASASLPRVGQIHADAEAGTAEHAIAEANPLPGERREVAYSLNVVTGRARFLGQGIARKYDVDWSAEIPGTTDSERIELDRVVITDDKTGFGYMVARAAVNLQLAHNAICAADLHGKDGARVVINRTATGRQDVADLDAFDLAAARERIRSIWTEATKPSPRVVAGDHCWRCECLPACPAYRDLALTVARGELPADLPTLALSRESIAAGWPKLKLFKKLLGEVERAYRAYASGDPVPLGNGKWLGPQSKKKDEINGRVAANVLLDLHGPEVTAAACEVETSKAAIERAIGAIAKRGEKAGLVRKALDAIAAAGGLTATFRTEVTEYENEEDSQ